MKIRLTENKLKQIVAESVKKILLKEDPTCWYGDTKPFETIYQMADKIVASLETKFTPEYYEGWPDDFSYEDMYEWAKKVRDDAGEYINCNSRFISTNFVAESVKNVLKEYNEDEDNYYGGGLPDKYFDEDDYVPDNDRVSKLDIKKLNYIADEIADIANNRHDDTSLLYEAIKCIEKFISHFSLLIKK